MTILHEEDVRILSCRFGDLTVTELTPYEKNLGEMLIESLCEDVCFFAKHDTLGYGILVEIEIMHPDGEDDIDYVNSCWNMPEGETTTAQYIEDRFQAHAASLREMFPGVLVYLAQHGGIAHCRLGYRAFLTMEQIFADPTLVERVTQAMIKVAY